MSALGFNFDRYTSQNLRKTMLGKPQVYQAKVLIPLVNGQREYEIGKALTRLDQNPVIGISVNKQQVAGQKTSGNLTPAGDDRFYSTTLQLRDGTDIILDRLPLAKIEEANNNGAAYDTQGALINIAESKIIVSDAANVVEGEAIELIFHYGKLQRNR